MTAVDLNPYSPVDADPTLLPLLTLIEEAGGLDGVAPGMRLAEGTTVAELAEAPHTLLRELVAEHAERWNAPLHVAATLWWKGFAYWSTVPVALGWALNGTLPALTAANTVVRRLPQEPHLLLGMREPAAATDVRSLLLDLHTPLIDALAKATRAGRRNLWGSVAESLARPLTAYAPLLPGAPDAAALLAEAGAPIAGLMEPDTGRRRTCCLWVTLPGAEACASCCLR